MSNKNAINYSLEEMDQRDSIPYKRSNRHIAGTMKGAIFLAQAVYWHGIMGGKPFYKFKEPCNSPYYKKGQSWCEELGLSKREFNACLSTIGKKIKQNDARDPNVLIHFWVDFRRLTYYEINIDLYAKLKNEYYQKIAEHLDMPNSEPDTRKEKNVTYEPRKEQNVTPVNNKMLLTYRTKCDLDITENTTETTKTYVLLPVDNLKSKNPITEEPINPKHCATTQQQATPIDHDHLQPPKHQTNSTDMIQSGYKCLVSLFGKKDVYFDAEYSQAIKSFIELNKKINISDPIGLVDEVLFYVQNPPGGKSGVHAFNIAMKKIAEGKWLRPSSMSNDMPTQKPINKKQQYAEEANAFKSILNKISTTTQEQMIKNKTGIKQVMDALGIKSKLTYA